MNLREIVKSTLSKMTPEIRVQYGHLSMSGPYEDRGFMKALKRDEREPFMVKTLLSRVSPGSIFLDIGAHLGQYSLAVAAKLAEAKAGRVVALEPHPRSFEFLTKNVRQNNLSEFVELIHKCASDKSGLVTLYVDHLQSDFTSTIASAEGSSRRQAIGIEAIVLDEFFIGRPSPGVIKVDVEGAELTVLKGLRQLIERDRPVLFIESNAAALRKAGATPRELFDWLASRYPSIKLIDESANVLVPLDDPRTISDACVNLICE